MHFITTLFKKEVFIIASVIWVELYWLYFAISMFCLMMFLSLVDTMLWYYIAHTKQIVSSRIGADGMMKKAIWIVLIGGGIFFLGNMSYVVESIYLAGVLSWFIMIFITFRVIFEVVSLVENIAVISTSEEQTSLKWISNTLMRIVWIGQKQIAKKIDKYSI